MKKQNSSGRILGMKRNVFKIKNMYVTDANGQEIIFPEVEAGDNYGIGDKVELVDDKKPTFEAIMPDGSTIKVVDGILKKIVEAEVEETEKAQKVFNCKISSKTVEIFSDNPKGPFMVGNTVKVNGKEKIRMDRYRYGNLDISVRNGKISSVRRVSATRQLWKNPKALENKKRSVLKQFK